MSFPFPEFFIVPEDVFRLGNSESPRMNRIRSQDVDTVEINGVIAVVANHKGISLLTKDRINAMPEVGSWVWKFSEKTILPDGLKLVKDSKDHYAVAPAQTMPLDLYKGLLEQMGMNAERVFKK